MRAISKGRWLLLLVLLLWAVAGHVFYRLDREHDSQGYRLLAELIEWKTELADKTPAPRVVIAGGSNAYYSLNPRLMRDRLKLRVVNLALPFGAHHYEIALRVLEQQVKPGDIVVFSAAAMWNLKVTTMRHAVAFDAYLDRELDWYARKFSRLPLPWRPLPESGPLLLAIASGFDRESGMSWVENTDAYGKFTACTNAPVVTPEHFANDEPDPEFISAVQRAAARLGQKNVVLTLSIPWLFVREGDEQRWQDFAKRFREEIDGTIRLVASEPANLTYTERENFCDSPLHLSREASRLRSLAVAESLQAILHQQ
jgi:hypothetical protein